LKAELGTDVVEGTADDLPSPYTGAAGPIPPLGGELGTLTLIDSAVATASSLAFAVFAPTDIVDIPDDEYSRLERPRIASFAVGGELPERTAADEAERKSA
jgi:hypothetical protein